MRGSMRPGVLAILLAACGGGSPGGGPDAAVFDAAAPHADPSAPTCVIDGPADGATGAYDESFQLMATANDLEDGPLGGASVVWRSDQQVAPLGSGTTLATTLPPGSNVVTCTATDSSSKTGSASVTLVSRSPFAGINHPADNQSWSLGNGDVPFAGFARDLEDGPLTGAALVWTSSADGPIGTGQSFSAALSLGVHTITLTATDLDGNTDVVTHALTVTP